MIKKERKKSKNRNPVTRVIDNSLRGLHDYLTAPNIRNKVKHPLFLAMKFDYCFSIFANHDFATLNVKLNLYFQKIC